MGAREDGYRYHEEMLRTLFRYAAVARIDHDRAAPPLLGPARRVGQGRRLRPVPRRRVVRAAVARRERDRRGRRRGGPRDGARLRAARDAAARAPADVRRPARGERHGRTPEPPAASVATLNTHDMPTWAGFWRGDDVPLRQGLGLIDDAQAGRSSRAGAGCARRSRRRSRTAVSSSTRRRGPARVARGCARATRRGSRRDRDGVARRPPAGSRSSERAGDGPERDNWRRRSPGRSTISATGRRSPRCSNGSPVAAARGRIREPDRGRARAHGRGPLPFGEGTHSRLADKLGAHPHDDGTSFAVWAPNADRVA